MKCKQPAMLRFTSFDLCEDGSPGLMRTTYWTVLMRHICEYSCDADTETNLDWITGSRGCVTETWTVTTQRRWMT